MGTSSGLNIPAAVQMARELGPGRVVATYHVVPNSPVRSNYVNS